MTTPAAETAELHDRLKPGAVLAYTQFIMSRTRQDLQDLMRPLVLGDLTPDPADPLVAEVQNGGVVPITGPGGASIPVPPGTAVVANSTLVRVEIIPASSAAIIQNGAAVPVHSAADVNLVGSPGIATVSGNALQKVMLTT